MKFFQSFTKKTQLFFVFRYSVYLYNLHLFKIQANILDEFITVQELMWIKTQAKLPIPTHSLSPTQSSSPDPNPIQEKQEMADELKISTAKMEALIEKNNQQ